jgi:hypothetical protein
LVRLWLTCTSISQVKDISTVATIKTAEAEVYKIIADLEFAKLIA